MDTELKKALIMFAKRPVPGRVKTRLSPPLSPGEAAELYRCMLLDLLAKGGALAGVDPWLFHEPDAEAAPFFAEVAPGMPCAPQDGTDLGERMANAFRRLATGYGGIAIIGTDLPDLPMAYVEEAFRRLDAGEADAVLGPADDGGYYLVAMGELHAELFRDVPWSSEEVLATTLARAEEAGIAVSLLPVWHDVDTVDDLQRPELLDAANGTPLTREFIGTWLKGGGEPRRG